MKLYFRLLRFLKKKKFSRHVSVGDLIFDRDNTAKFYGFGEGTTCYNNVLIIGKVIVGKNCWIGPNVILDGSGDLEIGDNCTISAGCQIYSHNSLYKNSSNAKAPTKIGSHVYVGPGAIIEQGIKIGDHAVIGALTLIKNNVPSHAKCWGIPGKIITSTDHENIV